MSYQTLGIACDALKAVFSELTKEAETYAERDNANPVVANRRYDQLKRLYDVYMTFEPLSNNFLAYIALREATQMLRYDSSLSGVFITFRTRIDGDNFSFLSYNLYDSTPD